MFAQAFKIPCDGVVGSIGLTGGPCRLLRSPVAQDRFEQAIAQLEQGEKGDAKPMTLPPPLKHGSRPPFLATGPIHRGSPEPHDFGPSHRTDLPGISGPS